jgi:uncharacterized membrane protein
MRAARTAVGILALAVAVALVALWPTDVDAPVSQGLTAPRERAVVREVTVAPCPPPQPGDCAEAKAELESGPDAGDEATLALGATQLAPEVDPGDEVRVSAAPSPDAATGTAYTLVDFERGAPMLWLALAFALLVVAFGRLRGALSLIGLAISLAIVLFFVVPAILDGHPPLAVALTGSLAVMLATIALAHGLGAKSVAAMLGTTVSLLLVGGLAALFGELTHLTGLASEEATILQLGEADVSLQGLVIAGIVIAALGVLDDVTVSQAATVLAVWRARPSQSLGELYGTALRVGRDHVSATVNTLALAYVGSSLPILLLFSSGELGFLDAVNTEVVAKEIVGILVGSIGLIAAVPITTFLAAALARSGTVDQASQPGTEHVH